MKKTLICLILPVLFLLCVTACKKNSYTSQISDLRSDLFVAETDRFSLSLACVSRESPYLQDGICAEKSDLIEIVLTPKHPATESEYAVFLLSENNLGGSMSFRSVKNDYFFSHGVKSFPQTSVTLQIKCGNETIDLVATSVKNENTISADEALNLAVAHETELKEFPQDGKFTGEFHVRLIRRDKNYYYVAFVTQEKTIALLMNADNGEILARRVSETVG